MVQTRAHLPSLVWKNYHSELEALDLKFTTAPGSEIEQYSIRYVDGHNKGLMVQGILALVIHLETWLHPNKLHSSKGELYNDQHV